VKHERNIGKPFGDGPAAVDVEFRFVLVIAVGGSDGDGEGVDTGGGGERFGFLRFGQGGFVAHGDMADLAFDGGSGGVGEFRAAAGEFDILLIRQAGAVEHDRGVAPFEGVLDLFDGFAVIEVEGDGLGTALGHADQASGEVIGFVGIEKPHIELNDDGGLFVFRGEDDGAGGLIVGDVEGADGALLGSGRGEQLP